MSSYCSGEIGPVYPRICDTSGPSGYWRTASTATSTPGSSDRDSAMIPAVDSLTFSAIRTRSNREPGFVSMAVLISVTSVLSNAASRSTTSSRRSSGISAARTFTLYIAAFVTSGRPLRSKIKPRGAGTDCSAVRFCSASALNSTPLAICR